MLPKILVFAGSIRSGSLNVRLAALATKELVLSGADVTRISLEDYPLPFCNGEGQANPPANAVKLKQMIAAHHGVFIASPEYSASVTPLLKNAIDWVSRVRDHGGLTYEAFKGRVFAIGAAAEGDTGGLRALSALRQILELGCGAVVIPEQFTVARANEAFDDMDRLKDERTMAQLRRVLQRLTAVAREMA